VKCPVISIRVSINPKFTVFSNISTFSQYPGDEVHFEEIAGSFAGNSTQYLLTTTKHCQPRSRFIVSVLSPASAIISAYFFISSEISYCLLEGLLWIQPF
jgi:hypothetical protein